MPRYFTATLMLALLAHSPTLAQSLPPGDAPVVSVGQDIPLPAPTKRQALGRGQLISNDAIGDGQDRWRTGSLAMSWAWGPSWEGTAPAQFGALLEARIQAQAIAPGNITAANPGDRPYAGALAIGLHTHVNTHGLEYALGIDLVAIGPQNRLDQLHKGLHNSFGAPEPGSAVLALQIANKIRPTAVVEMARTFRVSPAVDIRPFIELRAGDETLARIGGDVTIGAVGQGELWSRESITGQRYRVIYRSSPGFSFVVGGDMAYVSDSVYLPRSRGYQLTDRRDRLRAGIHWQGKNASAFYGLTYLGREFKTQPEGQITGSLQVKLRF